MNKQQQDLEGSGDAYQAGRDVTVYKSMSPEQMMEIMTAMAKQLAIYQQEARAEADRRLEEFRKEIMEAFVDPDRGNSNAFRDPDFQFLLNHTQEAFARSGEPDLRDLLVSIIAKRSQEKSRTRLAITLNNAAEKAPLLTKEEYAALSLIFVFRMTADQKVNNLETFATFLKDKILPLLSDASEEQSAFWHLEAQGCGSISIGEISFFGLLRKVYGGLMSRGFEIEELHNNLPADSRDALNHLIVTCLIDPTKRQIGVTNKQVFLDHAQQTGLGFSQLESVWTFFEGTFLTEEDMSKRLRSLGVPIDEMKRKWDGSMFKHFQLNATGIAIGYANAVARIDFNAPLNDWLK